MKVLLRLRALADDQRGTDVGTLAADAAAHIENLERMVRDVRPVLRLAANLSQNTTDFMRGLLDEFNSG